MTTRTLYVPVLIETAEQAETLPIGSVALLPYGHRTKIDGGWWETPTGGGLDESRAVVGARVFVPVEAEEERKPDLRAFPAWPDPVPDPFPHLTRLVTRWEEA